MWKLLIRDPAERMSIEDARRHPWIAHIVTGRIAVKKAKKGGLGKMMQLLGRKPA